MKILLTPVLFFSFSLVAVSYSFEKQRLFPFLTKALPEQSILVVPQNPADFKEFSEQQITIPRSSHPRSEKNTFTMLTTLLEMGGFSVARNDQVYKIVRNASSVAGDAINHEVLPLYVGKLPENLVVDDSRARFIFFLRNFKIPRLIDKEFDSLTGLVLQLLSPHGSLQMDAASQALIMTDKVSQLFAIEHLLTDLDSRGIHEELLYLPLHYLSSKELATILTSLKIASQDMQGRTFIRSDTTSDAQVLYTPDTHIVADPLHNALILLGRKNNINHIADFIKTSLDVAQESGDSILHFFDLQYLEAQQCASVLNRIVSSSPQSSQATENSEAFFKGVAIAALETPDKARESKTESIISSEKDVLPIENLESCAPNSGNRLVIAARKNDWKKILDLLARLDKPEPQVLLEVLIAEFTYDKTKALSSSIRGQTSKGLLPEQVQYLASHISPVNSVLGTTPVQLAQDLLAVVGPQTDVPTVANSVQPGSLLISCNDPATPGIFGLINILETALATKITSSPHITVTNNQEGSIDTSQIKRSTGNLVTTTDGSFTIPVEDVTASVTVKATPHIVSGTKLRLTLELKIEDFKGSRLDRVTRELKTTATLLSGQILAMGGLIRIDKTEQGTATPLISKIPLLGLLFQGNTKETKTTNISLFVLPTIIEVRKDAHVRNKNRELYEDFTNASLSPLRSSDTHDPIVRIFFNQSGLSGTRSLDPFAHALYEEHGETPKLLQGATLHTAPLKLFDPHELRRLLHQKTRPNFVRLQK